MISTRPCSAPFKLGRRVLLLLPFLRQEERISDRILDLVGARTKILQTRPHPVDRLERRAGHDGICQLWHRTSMLFEMERRTMPGQSPGTYADQHHFYARRAAKNSRISALRARLDRDVQRAVGEPIGR